MSGVGDAESPPYLSSVDIEGKDVVSVLVENVAQPISQQLRLLHIAAMSNEFNASSKLADRNHRQIESLLPDDGVTEERHDTWVRCRFF